MAGACPLQRRVGAIPVVAERPAAAEPDNRAGYKRRDARRSVPDVPGDAIEPAAAEGGRANRQRDDRLAEADDRRAARRVGIPAEESAAVPRPAGSGRGVLSVVTGRQAEASARERGDA